MKFTIQELEDKNSMIETHFIVNQIYKNLNQSDFSKSLEEMILRNNYKMVAVVVDGKIVAVAGYWVSFMLYCGRYLQISNLVVDENFRGGGIGKKILNYLENKAQELGCNKLVLDSYTENKKSHSLYFGADFYIRGLHFMKDLT